MQRTAISYLVSKINVIRSSYVLNGLNGELSDFSFLSLSQNNFICLQRKTVLNGIMPTVVYNV